MKQDVYCSGGISRLTEAIEASGLYSIFTDHLLHNFDIGLSWVKNIEVVTQILDH